MVTDAFGGHGGIALYMRDVLRCVTSMAPPFEVKLISRAGVMDGVTVPANIRWETRALGGKWSFVRSVAAALGRGEKADLILCGHINLLPLAKIAAIRFSVPVVLFIYGIDAWQPSAGKLARKLLGSVDLIISISEVTKQRFLGWSHVAPGAVSLVPNAIKLERFGIGPKKPELIARYGLEGKIVLMTLGRLSSAQRHKGIDEVIAVLPRLIEEFPDLVYLVAGGGDDIPRLTQKAERGGIGNRVVFTGMIDEIEKADHYRLADAFALSGHGDGFGFVLLEAMACGVPAVASVLDGSREAVRDGELGIVVNPNDADSLVQGISAALRMRKQIPLGLQYFSYDNFCHRLARELQPMLRGTG